MMRSQNISSKMAFIYCCSIFVILMAVVMFIFFGGLEPRPEIDSGEFPFKVSYEVGGKKITIEDTLVIKYGGTNHNLDRQTPYRWKSSFESGRERAEILDKLGYDNGLVLYTGELDNELVYSVVINLGNSAYYMGYLSDEYSPGNIQAFSYDPNAQDGTMYHFRMIQESDLEAMCGFKIITTTFSSPI